MMSCTNPECIAVTLDGIDFTSRNAEPGDYQLEAISGWNSGTSMRGGPAPYPASDGGAHGSIYAEGRSITLEGIMRARDAAHLWQMMEDLGAVLGRARRWGNLVVFEELLGLERQITVMRPRPVQMTPHGDRWAAFTLELQSATHLRLDTTESTLTLKPGGSGNAVNIGNETADLMVTLTGPLTAPTVTVPGHATWNLGGNVASGQTLSVDMARHMVRDPATSEYRRRDAWGGWPQIPVGTSTVTTGGSGSGSITLRWRSSWA